MKTKLFSILAFIIATTIGAQTLYKVHDYDDCKTLAFGGNSAQTDREVPVVNPDATDTANPNVTKFTPKSANSSVFLRLPYKTGITGNLNYQFRYYSDIAGTVNSGAGRLLVRLSNSTITGPDGYTQVDLINKEGDSWQTVSGVLDLSTASDQVKAAGGFNAILFVLNNVGVGTTPPLNPVFIDDVALSINPNLSDSSADLEGTNGWIVDYSSGKYISKEYIQSELVVEEDVTSPSTDGNESPTVMKITRGEATNSTLNFKIDPINYTDGGKVKFRLFPECKIGATTTTRFMLRKDNEGTTQKPSGIISLIPNIWNEIEIDLATLGGNSTVDNIYNNMLIFFNFSDASAEAANTVFYLDAFQAPAAATLATDSFNSDNTVFLLGNPVKDILSLSKSPNAISVFSLTGKNILTINATKKNYNVSSLAKGIYLVKASYEAGEKVFKFIKE